MAVSVDVGKYGPLLDRVLLAIEEAAKLTDNKWDDQAAAAVRLLFNTFVSPVRFGAVESSTAVEAFPSWLLPLLPLVAELLKQIFKK